ncbi:hypothetical protein AAMO2058_001532200 [Amorphochlora amoebiformis]
MEGSVLSVKLPGSDGHWYWKVRKFSLRGERLVFWKPISRSADAHDTIDQKHMPGRQVVMLRDIESMRKGKTDRHLTLHLSKGEKLMLKGKDKNLVTEWTTRIQNGREALHKKLRDIKRESVSERVVRAKSGSIADHQSTKRHLRRKADRSSSHENVLDIASAQPKLVSKDLKLSKRRTTTGVGLTSPTSELTISPQRRNRRLNHPKIENIGSMSATIDPNRKPIGTLFSRAPISRPTMRGTISVPDKTRWHKMQSISTRPHPSSSIINPAGVRSQIIEDRISEASDHHKPTQANTQIGDDKSSGASGVAGTGLNLNIPSLPPSTANLQTTPPKQISPNPKKGQKDSSFSLHPAHHPGGNPRPGGRISDTAGSISSNHKSYTLKRSQTPLRALDRASKLKRQSSDGRLFRLSDPLSPPATAVTSNAEPLSKPLDRIPREISIKSAVGSVEKTNRKADHHRAASSLIPPNLGIGGNPNTQMKAYSKSDILQPRSTDLFGALSHTNNKDNHTLMKGVEFTAEAKLIDILEVQKVQVKSEALWVGGGAWGLRFNGLGIQTSGGGHGRGWGQPKWHTRYLRLSVAIPSQTLFGASPETTSRSNKSEKGWPGNVGGSASERPIPPAPLHWLFRLRIEPTEESHLLHGEDLFLPMISVLLGGSRIERGQKSTISIHLPNFRYDIRLPSASIQRQWVETLSLCFALESLTIADHPILNPNPVKPESKAIAGALTMTLRLPVGLASRRIKSSIKEKLRHDVAQWLAKHPKIKTDGDILPKSISKTMEKEDSAVERTEAAAAAAASAASVICAFSSFGEQRMILSVDGPSRELLRLWVNDRPNDLLSRALGVGVEGVWISPPLISESGGGITLAIQPQTPLPLGWESVGLVQGIRISHGLLRVEGGFLLFWSSQGEAMIIGPDKISSVQHRPLSPSTLFITTHPDGEKKKSLSFVMSPERVKAMLRRIKGIIAHWEQQKNMFEGLTRRLTELQQRSKAQAFARAGIANKTQSN